MTRPAVPFPMKLHYDNVGFYKGERWIISTQPFPVVTSLGNYTIPTGILSNGASIPRPAQAIVGHPFAEYLEDAFNHDFLYSKESEGLIYKFNRKQSDFIIKETMWNRELPLWKIASFHTALRIFGSPNWKQSDEDVITHFINSGTLCYRADGHLGLAPS